MPSVLRPQAAAEKKSAVRSVDAGKATSLGRGFYLDHGNASPSAAMRSAWADVAGSLFPEAVMTDRSGSQAARLGEAPDGRSSPRGDALGSL